jgi:hypothetical protein
MTPAEKAAVHVAKTGVLWQRPTTLAHHVQNMILAAANNQALIINHEENNWSSITFHGSRHELTLQFTGVEAIKAGEKFLADLPYYEFEVTGQLVADASVREIDDRLKGQMFATIVLLLLEDEQ